MSAITHARTYLFVPGNRPEWFAKALATGADIVILDIEDAVPPAGKEDARTAIVAWLDGLAPDALARIAVRVNAAGSRWHEPDVAAVAGRVAAVVVAKAEAGAALTAAGRRTPVIALIETATGVFDAREIASAEGVVRLAFGSFDLAAELGIDPLEAEALRPSRAALVLASAAAGLPGPIDGVRAAIDDVDGLIEETEAARRAGFTAKLCIHPRQIVTVDGALCPSEDEVAWAEQILGAALEASVDGVITVDGRMVDKPVIERARCIAAAAILAQKENRP